MPGTGPLKKKEPSLHFVHNRLPRDMSECQLSARMQGVGRLTDRRDQINQHQRGSFKRHQEDLVTIDSGVTSVSLGRSFKKRVLRGEASPAG